MIYLERGYTMKQLQFLYQELETLKKERIDLTTTFENKKESLHQTIKMYQEEASRLEKNVDTRYLFQELEILEKENNELRRVFQDKINLINQKINIYQTKVEQLQLEFMQPYRRFFQKYQSRDLILAEDFPSQDIIKAYYNSILAKEEKHPIWHYGYFNIKELAEVIRVLYSLQRQKEFQILTTCFFKEDEHLLSHPNLYFLIGSKEQLESYQDYKNLFLANEHPKILPTKTKELITLSPSHSPKDKLGISCHIPEIAPNIDEIALKQCATYHDKINIFAPNMIANLLHYEGIQDTLSFPIHLEDKFLAEILISIAIYKKNRNVTDLTNDDYRYVFQKIFREYSIKIEKGMEQNIPKTLKYIKKSN